MNTIWLHRSERTSKIGLLITVCIGLLAIIGSTGGPRYAIRPSQPIATTTNNHFKVSVTPVCSGDCVAFVLDIESKSNKDIEIDWNKTLYIANGNTSGGFMFEGVVYSQRNAPKPPDVVFTGGRLTKTIYPTNLVEFSSGKYGGWRHEGMQTGDNGVYLVVKIGDSEIREKVITTLNRIQISN